jgi:hypothetical protein
VAGRGGERGAEREGKGRGGERRRRAGRRCGARGQCYGGARGSEEMRALGREEARDGSRGSAERVAEREGEAGRGETICARRRVLGDRRCGARREEARGGRKAQKSKQSNTLEQTEYSICTLDMHPLKYMAKYCGTPSSDARSVVFLFNPGRPSLCQE